MSDEIKYRIIKGKGEEEEKALETKREIFTKSEKVETTNEFLEKIPPTFKIAEKEPIPEPVPEIKPIETPPAAEHEILKIHQQKVQKPSSKIPVVNLPSIEISQKSNKKWIPILITIILIPLLLYSGFVFFFKSNLYNKLLYKQSSERNNLSSESVKITSIFQTTSSTTTIQTSSPSEVTSYKMNLSESTSHLPSSDNSSMQAISTLTPSTSSLSVLSSLETYPTASLTSSPSISPTTSSLFFMSTETFSKKSESFLEEKLETPSPKPEEIKQNKIEDIDKQGTKVVFPYLQLPDLNIHLNELNTNHFKLKWLELMRIQKAAGSLYKVNFLYNNHPLPAEFVKNYFFTPTFIEEKYKEAFKNSLGDTYVILMYYTYTRKFPVIIFTIKEENVVVPFMRLWDKESLLNDFKKIYLGLPQGSLLRFYTITEEYSGIKYKIAYYDNDYKFIWTIYNNNLIISTSLNAFKYIINKLK